ncbi:MAG: carboxypeptidase regulatory-like domain-containing protein [Candidatus Nitrosotenuis sp.]|nr:MAG: carboxypeptidase regulatory-like domain-containing protein [Candidatus Nitrosotenuis sp.]
MANFEVTGRVVDSSGKPVSNLVIQAFDSDQSWYEDRNDDLVGMDRTKNDGSFRISFSDTYSHETLERNPDLYLVIRDGVGKVLQKTEVRKEVKPTDKKQMNFDVTLNSQEKQDSDIYAGNLARTIAAFSGISDRVDLPSDIRGTFLTLLKTINAWTLYTREEMWGRIGYDGPQVGRYPWREPHDHELGWKK